MSKSVPVHKNIGVVASVTMFSRVLGLGRDMLTTAVFGASALNSAFVTAFTLPNLFRRLLGEGALTAALVPTLHEELKRNDREGALRLVSRVASWLLVVTGTLVGAAMLFFAHAGRWTSMLRDRGVGVAADTAGRWEAAANLATILFPYLIFVSLAAAFSAALQTFNRFLEPAMSPVWLNLTMIGLLGGAAWLGWADTEAGRMQWLCAGVLAGGFLQMLVPALALAREGWRPRFELTCDDNVRQIMRLMGPTLFGSAIYLVNMAVSRIIGLSLNDAAATVLNLSTRLMELPIGVFAVAVSTVVFPQIARHAATGNMAGFFEDYRRGMRLILLVNLPAAAGLIALSGPIVRLLFQRGAFLLEDTLTMSPVLMASAPGLPFFAFTNLALRAFYARKDTKTPVRAAWWSFVVNITASLLLMRPFGTVGLALAGCLAIVVQAVYLQVRLTRTHGALAFGHLLRDVLKVTVASVVMGLAVARLWRFWMRWTASMSSPAG
ncbi:MAG: murein biosynthesis integral membrane protein MurJ, partial [Opitutaceae bacterium]|nr:murein biosynthesis integral membrane protein MurJ [Opitutaceae bacterium]